jgi:two-component system, chemotaxis family, CheB/CheR fusion protein
MADEELRETVPAGPIDPDNLQSSDSAQALENSPVDWQVCSLLSSGSTTPVSMEVHTGASVEWSDEKHSAALSYPVVGIGASAGGLQAFRELLGKLPEKTGMAYVFLSHLAADKPSYLGDILARHTGIPVQPIEEGLRPEPDHIYVLLPGQVARLEGGKFRLERRSIGERVHFPIDDFFRSLASDQKGYSIGVVLSGADSDGTFGVQAIKGEGGLTMAQSPETAEQRSMPVSSIQMDHVDFIGSPSEIAAELTRLGTLFTLPQIRSLEEGLAIPNQEQSLQKILQILRNVTGLDLRQYKQQTIRRRIGRRMVIRRIDSVTEYANFLQLRPDEVRILHEDSLINVTRFFRDPEFWHALSSQLLPAVFQNRSPERNVRVWCAGCATGEEAYSFAISLLEFLTANGLDSTVQIFGTDASEDSIEKARTAIYPESIMAEMSPDRLRRFFVKVDRGYQVSKRVRDCCIFARQNLASDPPFSHIDLVSCRNVLIYFNQWLQKRMIATFHYALEPDGYLLLGMSESLRDYTDYFTPFDRKNKVYSKINDIPPAAHRLSNSFAVDFLPSSFRAAEHGMVGEGWPELELQRAADRIVLSRYAPPGLIVDERLNVLQARGITAPYVQLSPGSVSWNLSRVLREDIATEVKAAVERSIREDIPVSAITAIPVEDGRQETLRVEVLPITSSNTRSRCFLVLFTDDRRWQNRRVAEQIVVPEAVDESNSRFVAQLRQDLNSTRFHLQSLIEERDARNQELVSANEEIQSANEELQSTNEELETTKEELQSANEELQTVNEELQQRNASLTQTGNDLTNLLNSVNMPLLMLTDELKIRQFTPPMERLLNIRAADIGRSIREIRLQLSVEDIEPMLLEVLETLGTRELEVQDRDGKWNLLRIRPYRTAENKIDGLVVLLVDVDQLRKSQQELRVARDFANSVVQSVPVPVVVLEMDCSIRTVNKALCELTNTKESALIGRSLPDLVGHLWGIDGFKTKLEELSKAESGALLKFEHQSTTTRHKDLLVTGQALPVDGDRVLLLTMEDVTELRKAQAAESERHEALEEEVEVKDRTLSRTQEQLRELAAHLFTVQEEERQRVARDLHDDISQRLSFLEIVCSKADLTESKDKDMEAIRKEVQSLNTDVRGISHRLHPAILSDLGITAALKSLVEDFGMREGMPATYFETNVQPDLPQPVSTALYRITQEALRNVSKHAGETHVKVQLQGVDGRVQLQVRDFGTGFDQDADFPLRGLGLVSMQERARIAGGTFSVTSSLGEGTNIVVEIPVESHE